ncbi:MAG: SpoVA/SpoVAEb family sporulation membrane protein [Firmicutes bacterium]|nr:SpoVA/SpoVAEb family sporulation membrane protein [Bacillota bacterium]
MNIDEYKKIVKKYTPSPNKLKNAYLSFISGGCIGLIGTIIYNILTYYNISNANVWVIIILIISASILTGLSIFDNLVEKFKCGIIIPITGFAHAMTSSAIDYKKDGFISGIGSNTFKLAGSVILYGTISAFILTIIKVITNG